MSTNHPSPHSTGPDDLTLPFAGLGLDTATVRRKVTGLKLQEVPGPGAILVQAWHAPCPALHGYGLLLRLNRETLGS